MTHDSRVTVLNSWDALTTRLANANGFAWHRVAYGLAGLLGVLMSFFLLGIPVQLSDSFTEFTGVHESSLWQVVAAEFYNGPYFRPFRRGLIKIVFDLSNGHYYLAFRGFQAFQLIVLLLLVVRMLRVRSLAAASALPLGLAMVVGMHTFAGAILEGLPINHFLTILMCCAAAVNLAQAKNRPLVDAAAVALLVAAMLTIESGLLIVVVFVAAYAVGYRGVSRRALILLAACVGVYFFGRFVLLGGTAPGLGERSAGFGFAVLNPDELTRRFGANPWPFYAYNVLSAISCVLFAEPRGGVWAFVGGLVTGKLEAWQVVNVVTSASTTWLIARHAVGRIPQWRARQFDESDRFVVMFLVVLPANALFAGGYEKDVIMSPAGLFYGAAGYAVLRQLLSDIDPLSARAVRRAGASGLVLLVAVGWTLRLLGIHDSLRHKAAAVRDEWAYYDDWDRQQPVRLPLTAADEAIRQRLLEDAISGAPRPPQLSLGAVDQLFDPTQ
jgi:hypothetical protein